MRAIDREDIDVAYSGDICALVGVKDVITGDTLCDEDFDIRLEPPSFPEPVISMSIEPNSKADQEKMGTALQRLVAEDPTLGSRPTRTRARSSSRAWASSTSRSSSTG
jgi:elongation factor G